MTNATIVETWQAVFRMVVAHAKYDRNISHFSCDSCDFIVSAFSARHTNETDIDTPSNYEFVRDFAQHIMHAHATPANVLSATLIIDARIPGYTGI